jgi:hypothetical protein
MAGSVAAVVLCLLALHCGPAPTAGVETTNGGKVIASASAITGTAPPGSRVYCTSQDYTPLTGGGEAWATAAGADSSFMFDELQPGTYTLLFSSPDQQLGAGVPGVVVRADRPDSTHEFLFKQTGTIEGRVESREGTSGRALVYLEGTALYTTVAIPGTYRLHSVPPGSYRVRAATLMESTGSPEQVTRSNQREITVAPGADVDPGVLKVP